MSWDHDGQKVIEFRYESATAHFWERELVKRDTTKESKDNPLVFPPTFLFHYEKGNVVFFNNRCMKDGKLFSDHPL